MPTQDYAQAAQLMPTDRASVARYTGG